jgi:uncharacterized protein
MPNLKPIVHAILEEYALPWHGTHGVSHWARVLENGMRLAEESGANVDDIQLFAVFHDARRINEGTDPGHGERGAELAASFQGDWFDLPDSDFEFLQFACVHHTDGRTEADTTIQTCWDADRLDLGRVGIWPAPGKLCTAMAKRPAIAEWSDGRASSEFVPDLVRTDWGIETLGW